MGAILLTLVLLAGSGTSLALAVRSPSGIDDRLRLDWEPTEDRNGRPMISGYLYNGYARAASNARLLVETLDASGQVVARTLGFVQGIVPAFNRTYFNVPLDKEGASYRITVTSFEWRDGR